VSPSIVSPTAEIVKAAPPVVPPCRAEPLDPLVAAAVPDVPEPDGKTVELTDPELPLVAATLCSGGRPTTSPTTITIPAATTATETTAAGRNVALRRARERRRR
jgi:hypothetical protein